MAVDAHAIDLNGDAFEFRTRLEYEDDLAAKGGDATLLETPDAIGSR